jgi:hypothetical protein
MYTDIRQNLKKNIQSRRENREMPDDGGSTHPRNVGRQLFYTAVHPRRQFWTQANYFKHILRMPTYRIPRKIFNYHPNGTRYRSRLPMMLFVYSEDRNRPIGPNLADDDDEQNVIKLCQISTIQMNAQTTAKPEHSFPVTVSWNQQRD